MMQDFAWFPSSHSFNILKVCVIFYTNFSLSLSFHSHDITKESYAPTTLYTEASLKFLSCSSFNKLDLHYLIVNLSMLTALSIIVNFSKTSIM